MTAASLAATSRNGAGCMSAREMKHRYRHEETSMWRGMSASSIEMKNLAREAAAAAKRMKAAEEMA